MGQKRRTRGHWCWCCSRQLPNERFSGGGHSRHLCKECARLPQPELQYRQAVVDIVRIRLKRSGFHRNRPLLERLLDHPDGRVRRYVEEILEADQDIRLFEPEADELADDLPSGDVATAPAHDDDDIPF